MIEKSANGNFSENRNKAGPEPKTIEELCGRSMKSSILDQTNRSNFHQLNRLSYVGVSRDFELGFNRRSTKIRSDGDESQT